MTLKIFQNCDNKYDWQAYTRIGLYYAMRDGSRTNFCDVHVGWLPGEAMDRGVFSGPKDKTNQITRYARSKDAIERFKDNGEVRTDLTLKEGGIARLLFSRTRNTMNVWMFGPLVSEGVAYGSLVAELTGFEYPKTGHKFTPINEKTGKERETWDPKYQRYLVKFPATYGRHFFPCKLWGSDYSEGLEPWAPGYQNIIRDGGSTVHYKDDHAPGEKDYVKPGPAPTLKEALKTARQSLTSAFLPKGAVKVVWKVEDFAANQTVCQVYDRGG
jgi:hypothetical protein